MIILTDQELMQVAIDEAIKGLKIGDQPFGSVIVINDEIVSIGRNKINSSFDITAHAEILAIKKASKEKKNNRFFRSYNLCNMGTVPNVLRRHYFRKYK